MRTAGAGRTYSKLLFWESQFSEIIYNSYEQYKPQTDRLELPYVVKNTILRAAGVRRARSESLPWSVHMGAKTVPTSYRTPNSVQGHPRSPGQNIYYYIDMALELEPNSSKLLKSHFKVCVRGGRG